MTQIPAVPRSLTSASFASSGASGTLVRVDRYSLQIRHQMDCSYFGRIIVKTRSVSKSNARLTLAKVTTPPCDAVAQTVRCFAAGKAVGGSS